MYVSNNENLKAKTYRCGKVVGEYLIKAGIPLLSRDGNEMVFSNTKKLQAVLREMPAVMKALMKVGVIHG